MMFLYRFFYTVKDSEVRFVRGGVVEFFSFLFNFSFRIFVDFFYW